MRWLSEDLLHRRVPVRTLTSRIGGKRKRGGKAAAASHANEAGEARRAGRSGDDAVAEPAVAKPVVAAGFHLVQEAEVLVKEMADSGGQTISFEEAVDMLRADRFAAAEAEEEEAGALGAELLGQSRGQGRGVDLSVEEQRLGKLLSSSTIDVYVAAVLELYQQQRSSGLNSHPNPRTQAITILLEKRRRDRDRNNREAYIDRGAGGYSGGCSESQLRKMQQMLLRDGHELASNLIANLL